MRRENKRPRSICWAPENVGYEVKAEVFTSHISTNLKVRFACEETISFLLSLATPREGHTGLNVTIQK